MTRSFGRGATGRPWRSDDPPTGCGGPCAAAPMSDRESASLWELRPVPTAVSRRDGGGVVFSVENRDVRVDGDVATVERLVSLCDGHRTLSEIAEEVEDAEREDIGALADALVAHGVLVDCTQAYRVFHWQSSVESGYYREIDDAQLASLAAETFRPARLEGTQVAIAPDPTGVGEVAARRISAGRQRGHRAISFAELSAVLAAMYASEHGARRPVASAGALYPLVLHLVVRPGVDSLEPGLWWYDPPAAALELVRGDRLGVDEIFLRDPLSDALLAAGGPVLFVSADLERVSRVYANRGYRWALIE